MEFLSERNIIALGICDGLVAMVFSSNEEYTVPSLPVTEYWCDCWMVPSGSPERVPMESTLNALRSVSLTSFSRYLKVWFNSRFLEA